MRASAQGCRGVLRILKNHLCLRDLARFDVRRGNSGHIHNNALRRARISAGSACVWVTTFWEKKFLQDIQWNLGINISCWTFIKFSGWIPDAKHELLNAEHNTQRFQCKAICMKVSMQSRVHKGLNAKQNTWKSQCWRLKGIEKMDYNSKVSAEKMALAAAVMAYKAMNRLSAECKYIGFMVSSIHTVRDHTQVSQRPLERFAGSRKWRTCVL